jgi:hypothetical protein
MQDINKVISNLPVNMHTVDKDQYIKSIERAMHHEKQGVNVEISNSLRDYAHRIITPYILDANYKG